MDLRVFFSTFGLVFLAELGDKTQLATMGAAATTGRRWLVFAASASALVVSSLVAVLAGEFVRAHVAPSTIERVAGSLFIVIGAWTLVASLTARP